MHSQSEEKHPTARELQAEHPAVSEPNTSNGHHLLEVSFCWQGTTVDIGHFSSPKQITIGAHPLNDFRVNIEPIDALGDGNYPLIVPQGKDQFGLFVTDAFQGAAANQKGEARYLKELEGTPATIRGIQGMVLPLDKDETWQLAIGDWQITCRFVPEESEQKAGLQLQRDYLFWRITSFSAIAHMAAILMFQFMPSGHASLQEQALSKRFQSLLVIPDQPKQKKRPDFKLKKPKKPKQPVKKAKVVIKTPSERTDPKNTAASRVKKKGILGLLTSQFSGSSGTGSLFGKTNPDQFMGKLLGAAGTGAAGFGLGTGGRCFGVNCNGGDGNGGGVGGGGQWGNPDGRKYTRKSISLRTGRRTKRRIRIEPGRLRLVGSLTKEQIARVIRRNFFQIKFCYEQQLQKNNKLSGRIRVRFVIAGSGLVQAAAVKNTTMNNERVENCLVRRILRWKFPQPLGGGTVMVNYPFLFFNAK